MNSWSDWRSYCNACDKEDSVSNSSSDVYDRVDSSSNLRSGSNAYNRMDCFPNWEIAGPAQMLEAEWALVQTGDLIQMLATEWTVAQIGYLAQMELKCL